jgi:hypothetical protein
MSEGLSWTFEDHWSSQTATYCAEGYDLRLRDMDGNWTVWSVKRHGSLIAEGDGREFLPALAACESAMREHSRALREVQVSRTGGDMRMR